MPLHRIHRRTSSGRLPATTATAVGVPSTPLPDSSPPPSDEDGPRPRPMNLITEDLVTKSGRGKRVLPEDPTVTTILRRAQFIKRGVDLWVNVPQAINVGTANELLELYKELDPSDDAYNEEEKQAAEKILKKCEKTKDVLINAYKGIMTLMQPYMPFIEGLTDEEKLTLWSKVNTAAEQGRNNDTASLKKDARDYLLPSGQQLDPPISNSDDKSRRGVAHPQLLRMIVPMSLLKNHGDDEDFEDKVRSRKYKITHKSSPAFMYDVEEYNPRKPTETLLRGHYPLRVLRHIFTSPSSALAEAGMRGRATRADNATIAGQIQVTPEMIAYACVQARFFVSKLKVFGPMDETFNNRKFYYGIIKLFENKEAQWVQNTLSWWNEQVFGDGMNDSDDDDEDDDEDDDDNSFARLHALVNEEFITQTELDPLYSQNAFASED